MAQSAHLMTLGLCRTSAAKHPPPPSPTQHLPPPERPPRASQDDRKQTRTLLPCLLCPLMLPSQRLLDVHIRSHRASGGFGCVRCSWTADSWEELEPHWRSHCRKVLREEEEEEEAVAAPCSVCLRTFRSVASQNAHGHSNCSERRKRRLIRQAGGKEAELTDRQTAGSQSETSLRVMLPGPTGRRLQSNTNSKKKKTRRKKKKEEEKAEAKETEFCCSLCHRKFSSSLTLRRHRGVHGGERAFSCPHCSYCSRLRASLLQHLRTHTGEKPYRCGQCAYASIDRSSLIRHTRTHSQEKPHRCTHCDYSSIQKKSLDLHARRHHTGEAFPCRQCVYSSPDRQLLLRHVRRHHAPSQHAAL
ncbi:oocyte zinc finger protein XlCOF6 [Limanda limanda]|uniref:oocyte zinc finger protein XlCOF6 n=1 Tax=Limanda limanda TaxID=27771 RepID=UPI0029C83BAC|nr:oocyte zinc finger protein XlCOF6 [Limanda limanda]